MDKNDAQQTRWQAILKNNTATIRFKGKQPITPTFGEILGNWEGLANEAPAE